MTSKTVGSDFETSGSGNSQSESEEEVIKIHPKSVLTASEIQGEGARSIPLRNKSIESKLSTVELSQATEDIVEGQSDSFIKNKPKIMNFCRYLGSRIELNKNAEENGLRIFVTSLPPGLRGDPHTNAYIQAWTAFSTAFGKVERMPTRIEGGNFMVVTFAQVNARLYEGLQAGILSCPFTDQRFGRK